MSCLPYSTLYNKRQLAVLDSRKFFSNDSILYEVPPRSNLYVPDLSLRDKIEYKTKYIDFSDNKKMVKEAEKEIKSMKSVKDTPPPPPPPPVVKENYKESKNIKKDEDSHTCGVDDKGESICGNNKLFPIMDPRFNLREASKNMILLEDHLFHLGKRCKDCILKHCLTIEGFLEEGITLDLTCEYTDTIEKCLKDFREIFKDLVEKINNNQLTNDDCTQVAQRIRKIRKPLCQNYATFLG